MTVVRCDMTGCKHNSSCCSSPANNVDTICTLSEIGITINEEISQIECSHFEEDFDKAIECTKCQMKKYGAISIKKDSLKFNYNIDDNEQ